MNLEILEKDAFSMRFILNDSYPAFANALRRIMISEIPSMTIEDIFFYENSSVLHDEYISHRLGLIPLKTNLDAYNLPEKCDCKSEIGCNKCRTIATLDIFCTEPVMTVHSGELKFEDSDIAPVSDKIPIAKLTLGQKLKLEAHAKLGTGHQHSKWQPVSACAYKYFPVVEVKVNNFDGVEKAIEVCPVKVFGIEKGKIMVADPLRCTLCMECVKRWPEGAVKVEGDKTRFIFYVESNGCLPVTKIVQESVRVLKEKVGEFAGEVRRVGR